MDLKTFAVSGKLTYDHDLLSYVIDGKPVPIDVLETSLKEVIGPMTDEASEMLITDYTKMLREHVPITVTQDETGTFTVSGDVPDTVLESIEMVHGVGAEDAISAMIAENMSLLSDRKVEVSELDLTKHAEKMLMGNAIPKVASADSIMTEVAITQMSEAIQAETEQMAQTVAEAPAYVAPEPTPVEPTPAPVYVAPEPELEPGLPQDVKLAMRRIYDRAVDYIENSGLDERLGIVV